MPMCTYPKHIFPDMQSKFGIQLLRARLVWHINCEFVFYFISSSFFFFFFSLHSNILLRPIKKLQRPHKYHYRCGISHPCGKLRSGNNYNTAKKQQQAAQCFNRNVAMESIRMKQRKIRTFTLKPIYLQK